MGRMLIIVDMLNDFCDEKGVLARSPITGKIYAEDVINPISALLATFREDETNEIVWICDAHAPDDKEFEVWPAHAVEGTWGAEIIEKLRPQIKDNEHVINKTRYSGFYGTMLEDLIQGTKPKEVVVVGVCTSICVMDTVGGLANMDQKVVIPKMCVADFNPKMHEFSLERMKNIYQAEII